MSLFIRDDIPIRQLDRWYKKRMRILAFRVLERDCWRERYGGHNWYPHKVRQPIEHLYLKGA